ncbi:hypothetical protein [Peptostreptococcus faecalis]|uniref:hypothetical protein n=1 Tax=Peptostreptococcus faecalis TaxID=2045015 RepID=UPI001A9A3B03|nr:hypothetical protein [Peptostreptococcus faecalis]
MFPNENFPVASFLTLWISFPSLSFRMNSNSPFSSVLPSNDFVPSKFTVTGSIYVFVIVKLILFSSVEDVIY